MSDAAPEDPRPAAAPANAVVADTGGAPPGRNPWFFVIVTVALCVAGWFLVDWMSETSRLQDCVMSGRRNCAPMDPATGR